MSYTRIPNSTIDEAILNPYQFQLFSIIVRKTDGWCKTSDGISLSQFEKIVTFKRNKIISTLKELEELGFIKIINTKRKDGGDSFNLYSISDTLVSEVNGGSASHKQGGVREENTQKKANTKETNNKKNNKKSLIEEFTEDHKKEFGVNPKESINDLLRWFISHRKNIKSPIKTLRSLKAFLKSADYCFPKYSIEDIKNTMEEKEWKSVKKEWLDNLNKNQQPQYKSKQQQRDEIIDSVFDKVEAIQRGDDYEDVEVIGG